VATGSHENVVVIGAGPAGLTAAYELSKAGARATLLEKDGVVGGLARTVEHRGFRFDIGGHRFFTKLDLINRTWDEILGDDLLVRQRLSRIFFRGKLIDYPLRAASALRALGAPGSAAALGSYLWRRVLPVPEDSFEGWVSNRFGSLLYRHFFKTYSEKVWGVPCSQLSADWATQRIKSLSLWGAVKDALFRGGDRHTTLIQQFRYPRLGPGMMWERCREIIEERGHRVLVGREAKAVRREGTVIRSVVTSGPDGQEEYGGDWFLSSMPLPDLVLAMDPPAPEQVVAAARGLRYRAFVTAALVVNRPEPFPDQWIYVHAPEVRLARIQNYRNWSPEMVPDEGKSCVGAEYFVWLDDPLWEAPEGAVIDLAVEELGRLGLLAAGEVQEGKVVHMSHAYPFYDMDYGARVGIIREWLQGIRNLASVGRSGQHRYNNMDHSMMTGILAARNVLGETHDVWDVNVEQDYLEAR
jgi:protoporphyrinogen oxidase